MRIAYIVNSATYTSIPVEMANLLSRSYEVVILSLYDDQARVNEVCKSAAPNCSNIGFDYKKNKLAGLLSFKKELLSGKYDIVHTHQALSGTLARWVLHRQKKTKVVHTVHANHHSFTFRQNFIIGSTLAFCDRIIFNSESSRKGLLAWQKRLIKRVPQSIIYNGINVKRIQAAEDDTAEAYCRRCGIGHDAFLFAQVGRLEAVKNPLFSLQTFNELLEKASGLNVRMIYVGDGSQRKVMEAYVAEHTALNGKVFFMGTLQRDEVYSLMHRIDCLIVPSLYEGFCNALFEGMAAGIPIIASDIDVFRELLDDDLGITKYTPGVEKELMQAMYAAVSKIPDNSIKANWKRMAFERFDIERCISQYKREYERIMATDQ